MRGCRGARLGGLKRAAPQRAAAVGALKPIQNPSCPRPPHTHTRALCRHPRIGEGNMCIVHVSLVPIIGVVGEQKTKPTQHSVAVLRSLGLSPHLLACRCSEPLDDGVRQKLVRACVWGWGGG